MADHPRQFVAIARGPPRALCRRHHRTTSSMHAAGYDATGRAKNLNRASSSKLHSITRQRCPVGSRPAVGAGDVRVRPAGEPVPAPAQISAPWPHRLPAGAHESVISQHQPLLFMAGSMPESRTNRTNSTTTPRLASSICTAARQTTTLDHDILLTVLQPQFRQRHQQTSSFSSSTRAASFFYARSAWLGAEVGDRIRQRIAVGLLPARADHVQRRRHTLRVGGRAELGRVHCPGEPVRIE